MCVCVCVYLMEILLGAKRADSYLENENLEIRADSDTTLGFKQPSLSLYVSSSITTLSEWL